MATKTIDNMTKREAQEAVAMLQTNWDALTPAAQNERIALLEGLSYRLNEIVSKERGLIPFPEVHRLNRFELSQGVQKRTVPCLSCSMLDPTPAVHLFAGMTPMCAPCYAGVGREGR